MEKTTGVEWINKICSKGERDLVKKVLSEIATSGDKIYPKPRHIFRALDTLDNPKVVIIGQDPYHGEGQANGLAFAVDQGTKPPPSLVNIFKEVKADVGEFQTDQTLQHWADQGVVLLNSSLTVVRGLPGSHANIGWHKITNRVIKYLSDNHTNLVFILWGKHAQSKSEMVDTEKHLILTSPHPSPLSAYSGFFGSRHFSQTNLYLCHNHLEPIRW